MQSLQADDMVAIDAYFHNTQKRTDAATTDFNNWVSWFNVLGWYEKNFSQAIYDEARNRKHAFDLDNALTDAERAQILEVQKTGLSSEEMQGQTDRRDSTGNYIIPKPPWVPTWVWVTGGVFLAVVTGVTTVVAGKAVATQFVKKRL